MSLEDRVVLVTGASQGIGRTTADAIVSAGGRVIYAARREAQVREAAAPHGDRAVAVACDVAEPASVDALFAAIADRFGRLDAVFNNAGASLPSSEVGDISFEDWRRVLAVNLDGAFLVARAAFRMMRDQTPKGGRIVNNGSISAYMPRIGSAAYTASKHGVAGLTKTISLDGRAHDIACCQIDIGNAASDMAAKFTQGVPQADGTIKPEPVIDMVHVARTVVHMMSLPLDVNMQTVNIMATKMPFVGRG